MVEPVAEKPDPKLAGKLFIRKLKRWASFITPALILATALLTYLRSKPDERAAAPAPSQVASLERRMDAPPAITPPAAEAPQGQETVAAAPPRSDVSEPDPLPRAATSSPSVLMDRLVAAYPDFLAGHDGASLIWRDGSRMTFDDGRAKTPGERLELADIEDQFYDAYPEGAGPLTPPRDFDPGRARNEAFYRKMYGDCKTGEVEKRLVSIVWLPKKWGRRISVTSVNGVDKQLQKVSDELDALPDAFTRYLRPIAGIYNCRTIAGTARLSMHAYAAAIDINADFGEYWQDSKPVNGAYVYKNKVPLDIVRIFEKHGFIWGGRWYHYDTYHFEYRPELLPGFKPATGAVAQPQPAFESGEPPLPLPTRQPRDLR